jgi:hypothetical protein
MRLVALLAALSAAQDEATTAVEIELWKPFPGEDPNRNPYIVDHKIPMPRSVNPVCGVTDMQYCWDPRKGSGPNVGLTCEQCCFKTEQEIKLGGTCWPYVPVPEYIMANNTEEFCCKGQMRPDFNNLKEKVLAMSEDEGVRPPECPEPKSAAARERYKNLLGDPDYGCFVPQLGYDCEACCFNPATHPVVWGSNKVELVQKAACWRTSVLEPYVLKPMQENIPYDWWLECCMADCPPNWTPIVCAIMPYVHYMAILFFLTVVLICFIFEQALVRNLLCFANPPEDEDPMKLFGAAADSAQKATEESRAKEQAKSGASVAPEEQP